MADADALLRQADVDGARAALVEAVRSAPGDQRLRMFLFQLLAIGGEWDKARNQLQSLTQLSSEAQMLSVTYNQVIDAEKAREAVFAGTADAQLLMGEGGWAEGVAQAMAKFARGESAEGEALRDAAFDQAPEMPGTCDGRRFEWVSDCDSRFGPTFEVILGGKYGLLPFDVVKSIESTGPEDLRDTIWYPVEMEFRNGHSAAAILPARYPGSEKAVSGLERLGRVTEWTERDWGQQGSGQRVWTFSDDGDCGILEFRKIEFD